MEYKTRSEPFASQWQQQMQQKAPQSNSLQQPRTAIDMASAADQQRAGREGTFNQVAKDTSGRMAQFNTQLQSQRMGIQGNSQRHIGNLSSKQSPDYGTRPVYERQSVGGVQPGYRSRPDVFTRRQINNMNKAMLDMGRRRQYGDPPQPADRERAIHAGNKMIRADRRGLNRPRRPVFGGERPGQPVFGGTRPRRPVFGGTRPSYGTWDRASQPTPVGGSGWSEMNTMTKQPLVTPVGGSGLSEMNQPAPARQPVFNLRPYEQYTSSVVNQPAAPSISEQDQFNMLRQRMMSRQSLMRGGQRGGY